MIQAPTFIFDECAIGVPAVAVLAALLEFNANPGRLSHVISEFGAGALDDEWIPKVAELGYIVISADRGKRPSRGAKLPKLCIDFRVTHILLSASLQHSPTFKRQRAIVDHWETLVGTVATAPKGSRFTLTYMDAAAGSTRLKLIEMDTDDSPPTSQQTLFDGGGG